MNKSGYYERANNLPTVIQASVWDILTDIEDEIMSILIRVISKRNPGCDVKITFEVKERQENVK